MADDYEGDDAVVLEVVGNVVYIVREMSFLELS